MKSATSLLIVSFITLAISPARADLRGEGSIEASPSVNLQSGCPVIFPASTVAVAPNQPAVADQSTVGIINALCDVTLDFIGCGFLPTSVVLSCDANGDGVSDLSIPLKNITVIGGAFFQATIPALAATPGTGFPLACCGGVTTITLSRTVGAGDDNAFGEFTQTITCPIDLGIRAPVVISATPSGGDCASGQNILIPGSCFVLAGGKPNVTSVFAVDTSNPSNVIQAHPIAILSNNLVDAFFQIGAANAGKTFLIYASGPNGTSRNLTVLPANAPTGCPLGNEQGVAVTLTCKAGTPGSGDTSDDPVPISSCKLDRLDSGGLTLTMTGYRLSNAATITIGGIAPKKLKFKDFDSSSNGYLRMVAKGRICGGLPGAIVYTLPGGHSFVFNCAESCEN